MQNKPIISVIMGTYNEEIRHLKKAVESILDQSYKNFEFIIVLDNPNNIEIKNYIYSLKDNRIIVIENNENLGLVKSLNNAIEYSRGKYLARMDADDISKLNRLERQLLYMEKNDHVSLIGCDYSTIDEDGNIINNDKNKIICNYDKIKDCLKYKNIMTHPTYFMRRDSILNNKINKYREVYAAEDYDLVCRLAQENFVIENLNEKLIYYRVRKDSICNSNKYVQSKIAVYISNLYKRKKMDELDFKKIDSLIISSEYKRIFEFSEKMKSKYSNKILKIIFNCISKYHFIKFKNEILIRLKNR